MTSLAELIGRTNPGEDTRLRQAVVVAPPSDGTCSIRFGDVASTTSADTISGVHMLADITVSDGDTVWVLQTGGALLIIGKTAGPTAGGLPVGAVMPYWGTTDPPGWLICDGRSFSADTYPALAAHLGGTTLPNIKGRVVVGYDPGQGEFDSLGETGGSKTSTAPHDHPTVHDHGDTGDDGDHFHLASIGNALWTSNTVHSHSTHAGYGAEAPTNDNGVATAIPVNVDTDGEHHHTTGGADPDVTGASSAAATSGNLPPYIALPHIIKAA